MTSSRFLVRAGAFALAFGLGFPLAAQIVSPAEYPVFSADPAQALSENLKALARDPYNVDALIQAGFGALAVGDPNAAFGFFARAEELSPSNGRAKAGLGSALAMMEKPRDALRAFDEAIALGLPETVILADRGLAHDLSGDARKAQKDYLAALKSTPSDELTRRLALSLGISGEKEAALARLDPLIRKNDQAAWRARAFILAMNGDGPGAEKIVRMVAPPGTSSSMVSFMQRLADLAPAARASAVHFGTLPSSRTGLVVASRVDEFRPLDSGSAARLSAPPPERVAVVPTAPVSAKDARRKAKDDEKLAKLATKGRQIAAREARVPLAVSERVASVMPSAGERVVLVKGATALPLPDAIAARSVPMGGQVVTVAPKPSEPVLMAPASTPTPAPLFEVPAAVPKPAPVPAVVPPTSASGPVAASVLVPSSSPTPVSPVVLQMIKETPEAVVEAPLSIPPATIPPAPSPTMVKPVEVPPAQVPQQQFASAVVQSSTVVPAQVEQFPPSAAPLPEAVAASAAPRPALTLAEIVQTLELEQESAAAPLPDEAQLRAARIATQKKAAAEEKLKAEKLAEEKRIAEVEANARRNPARIWVQIATGNNRSGLPGTWRKIREQAGKSLARQSAWAAPFRQTNRLLVGPFKSAGDAREMVGDLAREGVQATTFSSDAGQEISRIGGK